MSEHDVEDATISEDGPPASLVDEQTRERAASEPPKAPQKPLWRRALGLGLKVAVSAAGLYYVYGMALGRDGLDELTGSLAAIRWEWFGLAALMQLTAIGFAIFRWRLLLGGQGIRASAGFLIPSFFIGRFWGAFTPGGLGLDGWRLYDVATQSKKPARAIAITTVEKILGQLAFGLVVVLASVWGLEMMGVEGLLMVNGFFVVLVTTGLTFLAKPRLFRPLFSLLPRQVQPRLQTLFDAVSAYHGRYRLLAIAVLCGVAVHAFNNLIYVSAAQAMNLTLAPEVVFFASSIVIMTTIVPISLNGIGLREATAAGVLAAYGIAAPIAAATYTLGWIAEMCVSAIGVPVFLLRRHGYDARLVVEDAAREEKVYAELPEVPEERWPKVARALAIGLGAGLLGGAIVGLGEGVAVVVDGGGRTGYGVLAYGAVAYGLLAALGGGALMALSAWVGRWMRREAVPEPEAYGRLTALIVAALAFGLAVFRIRRDVFHEEFAFKSKEGLLLAAACFAASAVLYVLLSRGVRLWTSGKAGRFMLRAWGSPALVAVLVVGLVVATVAAGEPASANGDGTHAPAPPGAPNVLVIVVDTLRADHLPAYGYRAGATPHLDRFAQDAVRYEQAFANASWTRPSFASILTGRYARSHGVMGKADALADDVVTLAEALRANGYATHGWVTNFNVNAHYNFQQGFDTYRFIEPDNVLWADDTAIKLLLMQTVRRGYETLNARLGRVHPGTIYQDAEVVNGEVFAFLERAPTDRPWFAFVGYMDPHDPYFPHPYDGTGYARAAHQSPDLAEADRLRALYDGEITYWDEHFGRLIAELQRRGVYDDTMIIVTSDHGEEFADHGGFWHGTTLYDEQIHVPLFVKLPRSERAGTRVSHWVQSIDLMPSILRRIGIAVPDGVQGGSLEEGTARVYAEESHEGNVLEAVRERRDFEELKLITANAGNPRGLQPVELYRVADDPREQNDVAAGAQDHVRALLASRDEARRAAAEGAVQAVSREMSADEMRQLCRLGYVEASTCCARGFLSGAQCQ
ncbi:MAG: sulfatase-like hydrolase/transferase [Sandaracinaceae bacterium]|nr:sulfatase-like hydrolase/transferase [Sandaracinaceae bacterium]